MKLSISEIVDILLKISLVIALGCSIYIFIQALIFKHKEYTMRFQSWQMPMIFALVIDLFLLSN
jgi:hypothetical protein